MVGPTRDNIHATVGSIAWNPRRPPIQCLNAKYCYQLIPLRVSIALQLYTEMARITLGHISELHFFMDDPFAFFSNCFMLFQKKIFAEHVRSSASNCSITLKPSKLSNVPEAVIYVGHVISAERIYQLKKPVSSL